jgi:hypothetical protein
MINVNDLKIFIDFVANKEQSGTAYTIDQLNNAFKAANIDLFKKRYGLPEEYVPGMPIPSQAWENTQKIKDDLRVFKEVTEFTLPATGILTLPSNYAHKTAIEYKKIVNSTTGGNPTVTRISVDIIDDDKWSERVSNSIKGASKDFPVCNFRKDSIQFEPKDLGKVELSYLRIPNEPVWGYVFQSGIEVYDANSSTDFEWSEVVFTDVAKIVLGYLSINLRDEELNKVIETYKDKGI